MPDLLLLYYYYFKGIPEPLIIQATNRKDARVLVPDAIKLSVTHRGMTVDDVINETVAEPISGISKRLIDGKRYVWAGQDNGWIPDTTTTP